jgi:Na+-driven multidrug efflux pump
MLSLWLPLAASIVMMVLEASIVNIGLGRTANAELALAAYGVALGLAFLVEAPIMMLLDASVARSSDRMAFAVVRRFTVLLGLAVTAIGIVLSFTPLYGLAVIDLMNIPPDVAAEAQVTLQILSFWSFPVAWRRAHQGVLIRAQRTAIITVATGIRLLSLALSLFAGLLLFPNQGAVVAGAAMLVSVTVEALVVTYATRPVLRSPEYQPDANTDDKALLRLNALWRFYRPLAMTSVLRQTTRPMLNAGIAAAELPRASLAAWPVAWGFAVLLTGPAWSLQQLSTALVTDRTAYRRVRGFALTISAVFSALLGLVAFTPLYYLVMGGIYNLSSVLQALARPALQLMVIYPLIMGAQGLYRGVLIRTGSTGDVRTAMAINVVTLGLALLVGDILFSPSGVELAAVAVLAGALAELIWLRWKVRF